MKKLLEVERCDMCPHMERHNHTWEPECEMDNYKRIPNVATTPSWCPLPDAVSGWRDIADAAEKTEYLLRWDKTGHIEDGYVYRDDDGALRHVLFDGQSLNDDPTYFLPLPPPPVGK